MKNIKFNYIPYNFEKENKNYLHSKIKEITKEENLIVVQSEMDKNFFNTVVNENKLRKNYNIISLDNFIEKIYFSDKYILRDIKRFMIFHISLDKEIKEKFNIKSYHDSIEIADEFFEYFSYEELEEKLKKVELAEWQKEKIKFFNIIKKNIDIFLDKNSCIPIDWLNKKKNLELYFLNEFKKIIFFDVIDFPENFKEVLEKINKIKKEIEIILQIKKGDFNEKELKLEKVSYLKKEEKKIKINILKYKKEIEIYPNIIEKILNTDSNFFTPTSQITDKYSLFNKSDQYLFNDSKLYKIIESYKNLLESIDYFHKEKTVNLFRLKENIFKPAFMEFYGLDIEDIKTFDNLLNNDFIYISLEKLENNYFEYYLKNNGEKNYNLEEKLKIILRNLFKIENIKNIKELNEYFRTNFFDSEENREFFIENKFFTIYDMFYEILALLDTNENMSFFNNFKDIFENNLGQNIFLLFFNHLNKITLYSNSNKDTENKKAVLKNIYSIKNLFVDDKEENIILNMGAKTLSQIKSKFSFLTENQKKKLNLKTNEDLILNEKYRFYQNLISLKKIDFYLLYDLENNIDYSSFVYEFIEYYSYKEKETINIKKFLKNFYKNYRNIEYKNNFQKKYRAYKKEKEDFHIESSYQLRIGAYDYEALKKNETFFFLKNICGLESIREAEEINGFSLKTLGIILHKTLENILKDKWKETLNSQEKIVFEEEEVKKYLNKILNNFEFKIEFFVNSYFKEIIVPRLIKNICIFFELLYKEIKNDKIKRVEAEKKIKDEHSFFKSSEGIEVILTGRADLVVETEMVRYIIDFKTGGTQKDQLNFYAVMLYGEDDSLPILTANYNFWEEKINNKIEFKEVDLEKANQDIKETIMNFLENKIYNLPKESDFKESQFDFNQFYNYKKLCENMIAGDKK